MYSATTIVTKSTTGSATTIVTKSTTGKKFLRSGLHLGSNLQVVLQTSALTLDSTPGSKARGESWGLELEVR